MKAVILSGGLGSRLKPFTEIIPKPLLPIGEKAIMEIQIEKLKKYGFSEIFLATNYKSDYIENFFGDGSKYGVKIHISKEEKPLGTAGPVKLLKSQLPEPFIVMNGDILTLLDFSAFYQFALNSSSNLVIATKDFLTPFQFGNILYEGEYVTGIKEKPDIVMTILAGIYVFKPALFDLIPDDEYFGMDNLILKMIELGHKISRFDIKEYWLDIGRVDDFNQAQEIYNTHFKDQ
ncbi:MAG: sugar phosphate nucleotidyltransferase [Candidatus Cloacimonetes bacterium]|nr:sugar phosphate nucleotidyltransferase [Candidatus Cloacimonadota bacterium]